MSFFLIRSCTSFATASGRCALFPVQKSRILLITRQKLLTAKPLQPFAHIINMLLHIFLHLLLGLAAYLNCLIIDHHCSFLGNISTFFRLFLGGQDALCQRPGGCHNQGANQPYRQKYWCSIHTCYIVQKNRNGPPQKSATLHQAGRQNFLPRLYHQMMIKGNGTGKKADAPQQPGIKDQLLMPHDIIAACAHKGTCCHQCPYAKEILQELGCLEPHKAYIQSGYAADSNQPGSHKCQPPQLIVPLCIILYRLIGIGTATASALRRSSFFILSSLLAAGCLCPLFLQLTHPQNYF